MQNPPEAYTPEKLFCMLVGILAITAMTFASLWFGRRHFAAESDFWWLPGVLTLGMLYVTYAARYEMPFWYPYDLPHFAIFGIACLLLLEDAQLPMFLLFLIDVPLRETSIYLVPLVIAVGYSRGKLKQAIPVAVAMVCVWLPIQVLIAHHFWHNASVKRIPIPSMIRAIANPLHWPQVMSAFGFLAIPLFLGRRYLSREQLFFVLGAVPCLAVTLLFGIWYETRIWDEWIVPAAALLATEFFAKSFGKNALNAETERFQAEYESV